MVNILRFIKKNKIEIFLFLFSIALVAKSLNFPFYWDNIVQISIPANWYFDTNFENFFVPDMIATGHPTFVAIYFALLWKLFGHTLLITHISMFPFVFGLTLQINKLIKNLNIGTNLRAIILGFVLIDTTLLSQMSLITFDIIHLFFYFLCINSILNNKKTLLNIAFLCLVLISLRATISGAGIILFHVIYDYYKTRNFILKRYTCYLIGLIGILTFLLTFYLEKGWIVHNTVSNNWKESAEYASPTEALRNIGLFIWRLIDFGRVIIFIIFAFFILKILKTRHFESKTLRTLFLIILAQFIVFFPTIIIYRNPFGHRYLIPIIIPVIILTIVWVSNFKTGKKLIFVLTFISLVSGHFWLYPKKIAQGWDASTLHWNYYHVRHKMLSYLKDNNIEIKKIGSFFPNTSSLKYIDLNSSDIRFKHADLRQDTLILYSNTFNVEDKFIDTLLNKNKWKVIKEFQLNRIYLKLFKKL